MAKKKMSLQVLNSKKTLQILISLLFICMGVIGFSSGRGLGGDLSSELSRMFDGGDRELLLYVISTVVLLCGLFLAASFFVTAIPPKFAQWAMTGVWIIWLAIIVILDILTVNFGRLDGVEWLIWIEQIVLHLIVLAGIFRIQEA